MEVWKNVLGYEGLYQVSNLGRVKSLVRPYRNEERILKQKDNGFGYLYVTLCKNGKMKNYRVNRLVALTYVPNPHNYKFVDHINGNKTDNRVENLRWVESYDENVRNEITHYRMTHANRTRVSKPVEQIDANGNIVAIFESAADAGRKLNICDVPIRKCCRGLEKTYMGYAWRYKKEVA